MKMKRNYYRTGRMFAILAEPAFFSSKTSRRRHLTLCQTITYEKQASKFGTIQAIWRTIQRYFESISITIRDNSRAIRDNSITIRDLSAIRVADLSAAGVTIGAMASAIPDGISRQNTKVFPTIFGTVMLKNAYCKFYASYYNALILHSKKVIRT